MAKEIERKFLVINDSYKDESIRQIRLTQGYLSVDPDATVRIRIAGDSAFITIKTRNHGAVRNEWEYPIPVADAEDMLRNTKGTVIDKIRYIVPSSVPELVWEVDEFLGTLSGLTVAEIELPTEDTQFNVPSFIGKEVTDDSRYFNSSLASAGIPS